MAQATRNFLLRTLKQSSYNRASPSLFTQIRCYTEGSKLFVGGISFRTTEDGLRNVFAEHGDVMDAKIIMDRETGRSRGFGFITYYNEEDANTALSKLNGYNLDGRAIRVDKASSRPPRPMEGFGGGDAGAGTGFGGGNSGSFGSRPSTSFSSFNNEPADGDDGDFGALPDLNAKF